jgi:NAD(P)-dependent dehydrogenase (short-subunit alcohol dehydrogenase family)
MATMDKRLAVVTGANKGIGFEVGRQLARKGLRVVLTSRDEAKGREALAALQKEGLDVLYHALDVTGPKSVEALAKYLEGEHDRVDVLVNNAASCSAATTPACSTSGNRCFATPWKPISTARCA